MCSGSQLARSAVDIKVEGVTELPCTLQHVPLDVHAVAATKEGGGQLDDGVGHQEPATQMCWRSGTGQQTAIVLCQYCLANSIAPLPFEHAPLVLWHKLADLQARLAHLTTPFCFPITA